MMPHPAGSNNISSIGVYRGRRGSQDTESVMLQAFGDQQYNANNNKPRLASSSSSSVLDISSRASSWKSVTLPASMYIRQLVPHHSQASLQFNQASSSFLDRTEDDANSLFGGMSHETNSPAGTAAAPASDDDEDAITLTGFRRMSKTPIPSLATSWLIRDDSDSDTEDIEAVVDSETGGAVFPATSSQIITRKIIQRPDGQYRLQTTSGPVQFIRPDGRASHVAIEEEADLRSSSCAPTAGSINTNASRTRTTSETSVPDKLPIASTSTSDTPQRAQQILKYGRRVLRQSAIVDHVRRPKVSVNPAGYSLDTGQRDMDDANIPSRTTVLSQEQQDLLY